MSAGLDVLLLETQPGDGAAASEQLEAEGHRVHRCFDGAGRAAAHPSGWAPCLALAEDGCPLDGQIDVALLSRKGVVPRPHPGEAGVRCAVRAGVPVVEDGGDLLDPFAPWIDRRVDDGDVVEACEDAARHAMDPVLERLKELAGPILARVDVDPEELGAEFDVDGDSLVVHVTGPALPGPTVQALTTQVVPALRVVKRSFSTVDIGYRARS